MSKSKLILNLDSFLVFLTYFLCIKRLIHLFCSTATNHDYFGQLRITNQAAFSSH